MNRLSFFYDISGRVSKESQFDKFFTVGGIIIPTCYEDKIRVAIGENTPKWRDSDANSLSLIENVLKSYNIYCTVVKIQKTEPAWTKFWDNEEQQYQYLSSRTKPKLGFAKSANVLKNWAFGECFATGLGRYLKSQSRPIVLDTNGFSALHLRIVCDTDIQGQENLQVFEKNWKHWCNVTKLTTLLEIKPYIDGVKFKTEQEETLLILPDYLSGYIHYSSDPERISLPTNLTQQDVDNFRKTMLMSNLFHLSEYSFNETFPILTSGLTRTGNSLALINGLLANLLNLLY